jgi:hypothetical protein
MQLLWLDVSLKASLLAYYFAVSWIRKGRELTYFLCKMPRRQEIDHTGSEGALFYVSV